jgi:hypothetical protein
MRTGLVVVCLMGGALGCGGEALNLGATGGTGGERREPPAFVGTGGLTERQTATIGWLSITNGKFTEWDDTGGCDGTSATVMAGFRSP